MKKFIYIVLLLFFCTTIADAGPNYAKRNRKRKHKASIEMQANSNPRQGWINYYANQWEAPKVPIWYPVYRMMKRKL